MPRGVVKTPGVVQGPESEPIVDASDVAVPEEKALVLSPGQLQALIDQGVQRALEARSPKPKKGADLPDQSTVDPDKIDTPVLTRQGYVVPKDYGAPKSKLIGKGMAH